MAFQGREDISNTPLILSDESDVRNESIAQDENRTTPLLPNTVMAKIAATGLWTPFNAVAGTDGSGVPRGIYLGEQIAAADLVEGDIDDVLILVGNARVNESEVVWDDDTLNADSVIAAGTAEARTAREALEDAADIRLEETIQTTDFEN